MKQGRPSKAGEGLCGQIVFQPHSQAFYHLQYRKPGTSFHICDVRFKGVLTVHDHTRVQNSKSS